MIELHVAADDRTGALETAAACADAGFTAMCVPCESDPLGMAVECVVTDLGSRHLPADEARRRASAADAIVGRRAAHKIDSTLRGNWAVEVAARLAHGTRHRCVVVASFPAAGRVCIDGVVLADGLPVADGPAGRDERSPVRSSRPVEHLRAAGVTAVAHAADVAALDDWLAASTRGVLVVDAADDAALAAVARSVVAAPDVLFAGTAAAIAALATAFTGVVPVHRPCIDLPRPVLLVCGSRHASARVQVERLLAHGGVDVVLAPTQPGDPHAVLDALAAATVSARHRLRPATLVVIGGDTASAVLGPARMIVEGTHGTGVARCRFVDDDLVVLARPGGFGGPDALVELLGPP